jgi:glyoxylase-like metal-dependent hydrolase (beta-lactamase superfamily II)
MNIAVIPTGALQVNTYVVTLAEGVADSETPVIVVDPGDDGDLIVATLRENHLHPLGIVLTHHHFDHVLGLKALCRAFPGIHIGAHPTAAPNFGPRTDKMVIDRLHAWGGDAYIKPLEELPETDVALHDGATWALVLPADVPTEVRTAAREWVTIHTPGHSAGGVCYYNKTTAQLLSGDTMFWGTWGRTDLPDSDGHAMVTSLKRLYELPDDTAVYPGHETYGFSLGSNRGLV